MKMDDVGLRAAAARVVPVQRISLADLPALVQAGRATPFRDRATSAAVGVFRPFDAAALVPDPTPEPPPAPVTPVTAEIFAVPAPVPPSAEPVGPQPDPQSLAYDAGLQDGLAQGRADGRAEAEQRLAQAIALLSAAHARLIAPLPADTDAFADSLLEAVRQLAAERAGQTIDADPVPFLQRIGKIAQRLARAAAETDLRLHPDDLAVLAPHLAGSALDGATLRPDPSLMRGDVDLRVPGVRFADLASLAPET